MAEFGSPRVGATAKEIARAVRRGDASATRVVADHLDHLGRADSVVSAFRVVRAAAAAAEAEKVDQQPDLGNLPLAGVPVAVKDNTAVAGVVTGNGSRAAAAGVADADDEVVRRLRGAGAVIVGTTRMPELGLWAVTDSDDAAVRNPWRTDRTAGGSSGGAAAAVAAGIVPLAQGNDGLGSVRIPAACCGVVGVKPGHGVLPAREDDAWYGLVEHGVLATTVADAALGLDVLSGARPTPLRQPGRLRVAVSMRAPAVGVWPDAGNRTALADAARALVDAGHDTALADPPYPGSLRTGALWTAVAHRAVAALGVAPAHLQPRSRWHAAVGGVLERWGLAGEDAQRRWRVGAADFFGGGFDILLTPVLAGSPPPAAGWAGRSWLANVAASARLAPYPGVWNVAGLPALSVPVGIRPDGIPGAVQLVGPAGSERTLLAVAGQLELLRPWRRHAPTFPRTDARLAGP
ncbi:amidase [Pilimelia terevasa]|nr:amidase family protein [Pilimelia terevasa]